MYGLYGLALWAVSSIGAGGYAPWDHWLSLWHLVAVVFCHRRGGVTERDGRRRRGMGRKRRDRFR